MLTGVEYMERLIDLSAGHAVVMLSEVVQSVSCSTRTVDHQRVVVDLFMHTTSTNLTFHAAKDFHRPSLRLLRHHRFCFSF